ncbi:surface carbohydrate biosynthesis protein [Finegoldia magna]|uniref:surface carbohydrate biosynthesis protein n=1 Tax=Finegoldia magna TaxID=1260 RepID=UPI003F7F0800
MKAVIVYERKIRELENAILLQMQLEKQGIQTDIRQFYEIKNPFLILKKIDYLFLPSLYETKAIPRAFTRYGKPRYLINLQYEQVLNEKWEKLGHHNPKGQAINAFHICWGEETKKRLIRAGVPKQNAIVTGAMQLDMLRNEFREEYLYDKEYLSKKYKLDSNKRWNLFISSFTYADIEDERLKMNENIAKTSLTDYKDLHTKSRIKILDWFELALKKDEQSIFIYRPHPDELALERVKILQKKYDNFVIIRSEGVKHWINSSDLIYSWFSTSIVEAYFLNKPFILLRPYTIDNQTESMIMKNIDKITNDDDFLLNHISASKKNTYLNSKIIDKYYDNSYKPAFERIINSVNTMEKNDVKQCFNISKKMYLKAFITTCIVSVVYHISKISLIRINNDLKYRNKLLRWIKELRNQIATDEEKRKIREILINTNLVKGDNK